MDNDSNGEGSGVGGPLAASPQSKDPSPSTENSFAAILEAANSIRKETMAEPPSKSAPPLPSTNAPTLEQLAAELSDGEEPFFDVDDADNEEGLVSFNEGAAYSAGTVQAISALSKGEMPSRQPEAAADSSESGGGSVMKPISLQDRTVAMLSGRCTLFICPMQSSLNTINTNIELSQSTRSISRMRRIG